MAGNYSKLWIQKNLNQVGITRAQEAIENTGMALPCHVTEVNGAIVTVAFDVNAQWGLPEIQIPKAESAWIRMPTQVGDLGYTVPADAYLGGVSGLGSGTADARQRGNLSSLVFVPVSNSASPPVDQNAAQIEGPNGAIIQATAGAVESKAVLNQTGTTLTFGTTTFTIDSSGIILTVGGVSYTFTGTGVSMGAPVSVTGGVTASGDVTAGSISLINHVHTGVSTGPSSTGPATG